MRGIHFRQSGDTASSQLRHPCWMSLNLPLPNYVSKRTSLAHFSNYITMRYPLLILPHYAYLTRLSLPIPPHDAAHVKFNASNNGHCIIGAHGHGSNMAMVMPSGELSLLHKMVNPLVAAGFNVITFDQVCARFLLRSSNRQQESEWGE